MNQFVLVLFLINSDASDEFPWPSFVIFQGRAGPHTMLGGAAFTNTISLNPSQAHMGVWKSKHVSVVGHA